MTYAELIASLQVWVESSESAMVAELDFVIELAEKRIYRSVDLYEAHTGDSTIALSQGVYSVTIPTEAVVIKNVNLLDAAGEVRILLLQKDRTFIKDFLPSQVTEGTPRYYAWNAAGSLLIAPAPDATAAAGTLVVDYTIRPTQLSSGNTTTWLSLNAPDVLLYACLKELAVILKAEPDIIQQYDKMYLEAVQGLLVEENYRNRIDEYRNGQIKVNL